jgi:glycosyltransferase involved in cell wall biosynthesis
VKQSVGCCRRQKVPSAERRKPRRNPILDAPTVGEMSSTPAITVTIPVYNGERYLAETIGSLLAQTFRDFQVIFVDDCSSDNSHVLIRTYAERDPRFLLLKTAKNQGSASKALNFALPYVAGDYFAYSSQDDLYSTDWLSEMYRAARESGAKAVLPDMVFYRAGATGELAAIRGANGARVPSISGREAVMLSLDWRVHGFALWNTELVRATRFKEFGIFADEYTVRELFMACETVAFSGGTFFYRQDNPQAITQRRSVGTFSRPYNYVMLSRLLSGNAFPRHLCTREMNRALTTLVRLQLELLDPAMPCPEDFRNAAEHELRGAFEALKSPDAQRALAHYNSPRNIARRAMLAGSYEQFRAACTTTAPSGDDDDL